MGNASSISSGEKEKRNSKEWGELLLDIPLGFSFY